MCEILICITIGLAAGILSGLIGIGGGIVIIPLLIMIMGFSQHTAQGTTIACMIPPIGLLGAITYWKKGFVDFKVAAIICLGFFVGSLIGANIATIIPEFGLKKIFGVALIVIAIKMIFFK